MFFIGVIFLIVSAIFVYGTEYTMKIFRGKSPIVLKFIGFFIGIIGIFMIMYGDFPESLEFIRIFKRLEFTRIF